MSIIVVATVWLQNAGQQSPGPWFTWTVLGAGLAAVIALLGTIYSVRVNQRTQQKLGQQRQDFEREMSEFEKRYEEEQANKAVIRKVLKACNRRAVTAQMHAEQNYEAMFEGIRESRISLQQTQRDIRVENQQQIVENIIEEMRVIEAREETFRANDWDWESVEVIDRAKLSIIRHLMELRGCADRRVANVSTGYEEPICSFGESTSMKGSEPIRASS